MFISMADLTKGQNQNYWATVFWGAGTKAENRDKNDTFQIKVGDNITSTSHVFYQHHVILRKYEHKAQTLQKLAVPKPTSTAVGQASRNVKYYLTIKLYSFWQNWPKSCSSNGEVLEKLGYAGFVFVVLRDDEILLVLLCSRCWSLLE